MGPHGHHQRLRGPWSRPPGNGRPDRIRRAVIIGSERAHHVQDACHNRLANGHAAQQGLGGHDVVGTQNLRRLGFCAAGCFKYDLFFRLAGRVAERDLEQEAVKLRLGQGVGAFLFDRVLCGQDVKRAGQVMWCATNGDLAFLHCLQQGRLGARAGAVYFICHQELAKDRAFEKSKGS